MIYDLDPICPDKISVIFKAEFTLFGAKEILTTFFYMLLGVKKSAGDPWN